MRLELLPLEPKHDDVLANLWQFYIVESSARDGLNVDADGRFDVPDVFAKVLHAQDGNTGYLLRRDGAIAGFLLLHPAAIEGRRVTEFADLFVLPYHRRHGIATAVIERVMLPSTQPWLVAVLRNDPDAEAFWLRAFDRLPFRSWREIVPSEVPEVREFLLNE